MKVMTPLNGHIEKVMAPHYGQWTLQIQSQKKILMHIYKFKDTPGSSAKTLNWKPLKAMKVLYYIYIVLSFFLFFFSISDNTWRQIRRFRPWSYLHLQNSPWIQPRIFRESGELTDRVLEFKENKTKTRTHKKKKKEENNPWLSL